MSEFFILEVIRTMMFIIGTLTFAFVCIKRRDLVSWLPAYIAGTISEILRLISEVDYDIYYLIGLGFSSLTLLIMIIAVSHEYYRTFYKSPRLQIIPILQISIVQIIISIGLQVVIGILLIIAFFMILRITLKKRTPIHAFFCFIIVCGILNLIAITLRDAGLEGAEEFYQFISIILATNLLLTGLVALIEERLVKSETRYRSAFNRAEFYKDLFIHDINNILQNLQFSLDIIAQKLEKIEEKETFDDLIKIAKGQVNRGAELGLNVKKLSDLEIGAIKKEPVDLYNTLQQAIDYVNSEFPEVDIRINIDSKHDKVFIDANVLIIDVFRIILNNAVRYNDNSIKEIVVKISKEVRDYSSNIKIEFIDSGVGMPDAIKKNIFQPVYRKTKDFKRIGLGLLLVNVVVGNLSGKVWAEDRIQGDHTKGTNVILLIPETHGILDTER